MLMPISLGAPMYSELCNKGHCHTFSRGCQISLQMTFRFALEFYPIVCFLLPHLTTESFGLVSSQFQHECPTHPRLRMNPTRRLLHRWECLPLMTSHWEEDVGWGPVPDHFLRAPCSQLSSPESFLLFSNMFCLVSLWLLLFLTVVKTLDDYNWGMGFPFLILSLDQNLPLACSLNLLS